MRCFRRGAGLNFTSSRNATLLDVLCFSRGSDDEYDDGDDQHHHDHDDDDDHDDDVDDHVDHDHAVDDDVAFLECGLFQGNDLP